MFDISRDDFERLREDFDQFVEATQVSLKTQRDSIESKATMADLATLQTNFNDRLNELLNNFGDMFADKEATRKKTAALEKAVRKLHEMVKTLQQVTQAATEDEAMFTKKYVGPADCASCDKGIINLSGSKAEPVHWNRLPFKDPSERIARVSFTSLRSVISTAKAFQDSCKQQPHSPTQIPRPQHKCTSRQSLNTPCAKDTKVFKKPTNPSLTPPSSSVQLLKPP